jgi:sRNA-binding carbon storage regulator CsrA
MTEQKKKDYGRLTLTMRDGESVILGDTLITVVRLKNKELRLQFNAPKDIRISRTNNVDKIKK